MELNKIKCIYCGNSLSLNYYLKHLKTNKHYNTKKKLIDESLIVLPKDINGIIFQYFDDTPLEIKRYRRIKYSIKYEKQRRQIMNEERIIINNKWYNKYPRRIKNFIYKVFNPL